MPSIATYFALANELERRLRFRSDAFTYGCILPEIISPRDPAALNSKIRLAFDAPYEVQLVDPHYRQESAYGLVPNLRQFWALNELDRYMRLGYAAHLMLDRDFLEKLCPYLGLEDPETTMRELIYEDYRRMNYLVVREFEVDLERADRVLSQEYFHLPVSWQRYQQSLIEIKGELDPTPPQCIDLDTYCGFIRDAATSIMRDEQFWDLGRELGLIC